MSSFQYQPLYCEENIWQLIAHPLVADKNPHAVFLSTANRKLAMHGQRAGFGEHGHIVWDYHVILIAQTGTALTWEVWDLDTTLSLPLAVATYLDHSFPNEPEPEAENAPRFRVIDGQTYRAEFASDRSHMRAADGTWQAAPPDWPLIGNGIPRLPDYIDMTARDGVEIIGLQGLRQRFSAPSATANHRS